MTAPTVFHRTRHALHLSAFTAPLVRYGDNEHTSKEHGQLWSRLAEGKRRD